MKRTYYEHKCGSCYVECQQRGSICELSKKSGNEHFELQRGRNIQNVYANVRCGGETVWEIKTACDKQPRTGKKSQKSDAPPAAQSLRPLLKPGLISLNWRTGSSKEERDVLSFDCVVLCLEVIVVI